MINPYFLLHAQTNLLEVLPQNGLPDNTTGLTTDNPNEGINYEE